MATASSLIVHASTTPAGIPTVGHVPVYQVLPHAVYRMCKYKDFMTALKEDGTVDKNPDILSGFKLARKVTESEATLSEDLSYKELKKELCDASSAPRAGKILSLKDNDTIRGISVGEVTFANGESPKFLNTAVSVSDYGRWESVPDQGNVCVSIPVNNEYALPDNLKEKIKINTDFKDDEDGLPGKQCFQEGYFCFVLEKGTVLPQSLKLFEDIAPPPSRDFMAGHRTIAPFGDPLDVNVRRLKKGENLHAVCTDLSPSWKLHCFTLTAAAEPENFKEGQSDKEIWGLAQLLFKYVSELEFDDAILVLAVLDSLKIAQYSDLQHPLDTLEISCHRWRAVLDAIIGVAEFHDALQLMHARERTMVFGPVGCCTFV
eukprot:m.741038 g.741038  ORF g.741038 m.741038 type:complete len:375 (+) comp23116_c3_seq41:331-1455(+)